MTETKSKYISNSLCLLCVLYVLTNMWLSIWATGHCIEQHGGSSPYYAYIGWEWGEVSWIAIGVVTFCSIFLVLPWLYACKDLKQFCKLSALLPVGRGIGGLLYILINLLLATFVVFVLSEKATVVSRAIIDNGDMLIYDSWNQVYLAFVLLTIFPIYTFATFMILPVRKELKEIRY